LACSDGLFETEEGGTKGSNTLLEEDRASVDGGTSDWDLDAETVLGNANLLEFSGVSSSVFDDLVGVVCNERRSLEEDPALDVVDVLFTKKHAL
jgi:hypothetical protein